MRKVLMRSTDLPAGQEERVNQRHADQSCSCPKSDEVIPRRTRGPPIVRRHEARVDPIGELRRHMYPAVWRELRSNRSSSDSDKGKIERRREYELDKMDIGFVLARASPGIGYTGCCRGVERLAGAGQCAGLP